MPSTSSGGNFQQKGTKRGRRRVKPPKPQGPYSQQRGPSKGPTAPKPPAPRRVVAPKSQPGPFTNAERKKVRKNTTKAPYQRAIRVARKRGTHDYHGRADVMTDAQRAKAEKAVKLQYVQKYGPNKTVRLTNLVTGKTHVGKLYPEHTTVPPDIADKAGLEKASKAHKSEQAIKLAPVLTALDQTTRPLHAIAAAAKANVHDLKVHGYHPLGTPEGRKAARHAALRGIENKDKSTFSDVLEEAGVHNKIVKGVLGFTGDVVIDPTTWATGGVASVARQAAEKEATRVAKKALAKGLSEDQARRFAERAAKKTLAKHPEGRGITIRFAGKQVPGVTRATAKAARGTGKVVRRVTPRKVAEKAAGTRQGVRAVAADVNPNVVPEGVTRAQHEAVTAATRSARGKTNVGIRKAEAQAVAIQKRIGKSNYARVIDALESGSLKTLPKELRVEAVKIRSALRHANRLRKQAGIRGGERKNYVPRQRTEESLAAEGKPAKRGSGSKTIRPAYMKARSEQRPMSELRVEEPGKYSEDLARLYGDRIAAGHSDVAKAELNRKLADMGRPVRKGKPVDLKSGESVYHVEGSNISAPLKEQEVQAVVDKGGKKGRYVILNDDVVKRAVAGVAPAPRSAYGIGRTADRVTGGFKRIAIATPGFHVRNFVGDTQNAYLGQSGLKLPGNLARSGRVLKAAGRLEKADSKFAQATTSTKGLHLPKYGEVSYEDIAKNLAAAGGYRSGYTSRELPELTKSGAEGTLRVRRVGLPKTLKRAALNREDLPRVATAINALRNGATWEEAASQVAKYHFDYAHLTDFERNVARRVIPFYTFSARNIPLQAKSFISKPGKFANYQKLREEATKATGSDKQDADTRFVYDQLARAGVKLPNGWQRQLSQWEQRNAGVPVSWKGHRFTVSLGLPLQDLSEFPGLAGKGQADEYYQKFMSLLNPIGKDPIEYGSNFSFFFRDQIENDHSPLVSAPGWVGSLPPALKKSLGVVRINDKKLGKKVWGWPAKADYIAKAIPGTPSYVQQISAGGTDRRGRTQAGKVLGFLGVKSVPIDPVKNAVALSYARGQEITKQLAKLNQQGINASHPNQQFRRLQSQQKTLKAIQDGAVNGVNKRLIDVENQLTRVQQKIGQTKRSADGFYYTAQYQRLLDQQNLLTDQRNRLQGKSTKKSVTISRRPLSLRAQLEQDAAKLRGGNLRQELERELQRDQARSAIVNGGG